MTDPVPSKEEVWSDGRILDELGDYDASLSRRHCEQIFKQALGMIQRLRTALRGIQSCSTCEACRGAATLTLGGTCLGGCGTHVPSKDAYCSACFLKARAASEPCEQHEELIRRLRSFGQAYPYDMFPALTSEERAKVGGDILSRISAAMGRHCSKIMAEAADALERAAQPPRDVQS